MRLKTWFCGCLRPLEARTTKDAASAAHQDGSKANCGGSDHGLQEVAENYELDVVHPQHQSRMVLCQALVDANPEPVRIFEPSSGRLILCNAASRDLPGGCANLMALFELDPPSLSDALSRVQAGLCWKGASSHHRFYDPDMSLLPP